MGFHAGDIWRGRCDAVEAAVVTVETSLDAASRCLETLDEGDLAAANKLFATWAAKLEAETEAMHVWHEATTSERAEEQSWETERRELLRQIKELRDEEEKLRSAMSGEKRECSDLEAWTKAHLDHMAAWVNHTTFAARKVKEATALLEEAASRGHAGAREALFVLRGGGA